MSSPPNLATSPTYPSPANLPNKKRPSTTSNPIPQKRRKASTATSAPGLHPLRQTSFPPEEFPRNPQRSPSVESSLGGGNSVRERGRRSDGRSVLSGSIRAGRGGAGGQSKSIPGHGNPEEEEEDDDDADEDMGLLAAGQGPDGEAEKERERILLNHFSEEQNARYEMFMRAKPQPSKVKTIANKVLNQSVPNSVMTTITGITKSYAGSIIEKAREVQLEWLRAAAPEDRIGHEDNPGPLLPDHLREAARRYRKDGEGGTSTVKGMGRVGVEPLVLRSGQRRLFR